MNPNPNIDPAPSCSASTANRLKILSNDASRKSIMLELRRLIKEIARVDLENKITSLVHELYMDAEYRERTNIQMQEIVVQLENKIAHLERTRPDLRKESRTPATATEVLQLQESLSRYERLLFAADSERLRLMD